jgi:hypothetical protein
VETATSCHHLVTHHNDKCHLFVSIIWFFHWNKKSPSEQTQIHEMLSYNHYHRYHLDAGPLLPSMAELCQNGESAPGRVTDSQMSSSLRPNLCATLQSSVWDWISPDKSIKSKQ